MSRHHFTIRKPDDPHEVTVAVDLDRELDLRAIEVRDVRQFPEDEVTNVSRREKLTNPEKPTPRSQKLLASPLDRGAAKQTP
jgi:hypothetical protein